MKIFLTFSVLLAFHKPFGVVSQFTSDRGGHRTLADFGFPLRVYPLGRLDTDSEGLLLLSDEPGLNSQLLAPENAHPRTYCALVERVPTQESLEKLRRSVVIEGRRTLPCAAALLDPQPVFPPRDPPVRFRKNVADVWLELTLIEGRNRQVRKMTAAIGHPCLRLLRIKIGAFALDDLPAGHWKELSQLDRKLIFS